MSDEPKNPYVRKVVEALKDLPTFLEEKRRKRIEREQFVERVFGAACREAGLTGPNRKHKWPTKN